MFGRSDDEWDAIVDDAISFLQEQAKLKRVTTYTALNTALASRGHVPFDFELEIDRKAIGSVLGHVVSKTIGDSGVMLSAIVAYLNRNDAGPGFYALAIELGLLASAASPKAKYGFWLDQVNKVHELYARPPRRRIRPNVGAAD